MRFFSIVFMIYVVFLYNPCFAQAKKRIIVPFEIVNDRMIAKLETDETTLNLIFDVASNVCMIDSTKANNLDFKFGFNKPADDLSSYFKAFSGKNALPKTHWIVKEFKHESERLNYNLDGLFGAYSLIKNNNTVIDFKQKIIIIDTCLNPSSYFDQISFEISTVNKSKNGLGTHYPKLLSINTTIQFDSILTKSMDLIIDTGSKYGVALICNDSTLIDSILLYKDDYSIFNSTKKIGFTSSIIGALSPFYYKTPIFFRPEDTAIMNNNFYGLIGIPILKNFDKIYIDWTTERVYLIKKTNR